MRFPPSPPGRGTNRQILARARVLDTIKYASVDQNPTRPDACTSVHGTAPGRNCKVSTDRSLTGDSNSVGRSFAGNNAASKTHWRCLVDRRAIAFQWQVLGSA